MTNTKHNVVKQLAFACSFLTGSLAFADKLNLVQSPPGNGSKQPAPNVIITVDNSESMRNKDTDGGQERLTLLKNSLKAQFGDGTPNSGKIPDKRIRLAWQAMFVNKVSSTNSLKQASDVNTLLPGAINSMKSFEGAHRINFNAFVTNLKTDYGTPSLTMMRQAHNYMLTTGANSPWADEPGNPETAFKDCRRTYHVFMTDGAWTVLNEDNTKTPNNEGTNDFPYESHIFNTLGLLTNNPLGFLPGDSTTQILPDNKNYDITSDQTRVYRDEYGDKFNNKFVTFSDLAFRSWATDLQPNMSDRVRPLIKKVGDEKFLSTTLQEYWNPKNDPARWQHINTYTIGFGLGAVNWPNTSITPVDWDDTTVPNPNRDNYGGDFPKLVNGDKFWPALTDGNIRPIELWHGALNGRGKYYPAKTQDDLTAAFAAIMDTITIDTSKPVSTIAANSSTLRLGSKAYKAGYDAEFWSGKITAHAIDATKGTISESSDWQASDHLDSNSFVWNNRFVLSYNGTSGIAWNSYANLPTAHKTPLTKNSTGTVDTNGEFRFNYLRGDRSKEAAKSGGIFRDRGATLLGDIVNSNIWYTGKPGSGYNFDSYATFRSTLAAGGTSDTQLGGRIPMVYVGANDGMLHGFVANNWPTEATPTMAGGKELLAYIPQGIARGNLRKLTDTTYAHQYYVDGSPFTGDAYIGSTPKWTTVLVGSLGAGGKGYFVLDVTDPSKFTNTNAASLVLLDTTATTDADIGNIVTPPVIDEAVSGKSSQIVRMNNGRWAAVMGNGVNSDNEEPVLLIQYLDGDKALKKISPCGTNTSLACDFKESNGLSTPQLIDLNGNDKVDIAYAGDIKGNLWKFDLTSATDADWTTVTWKNDTVSKPFFVTKTDTLAARPITTAPYWMQHPKGGIMLLVGTGINLTLADQTTEETNSIYGLHDNFTTAINSSTSTDSLDTLLQQQTITGTFGDNGTTYYQGSGTTIGTDKRGWYLNWTIPGQRVLHNPRGFTGQKVLVQSTIPKSGSTADVETCSALPTSERTFLTIVNMITGRPSALPPFTIVDANNSNRKNIITIENPTSGDILLMRSKDKLLATGGGNTIEINPDKYMGLRANWREIQ